MRVNPGESYADMIDHDAEREYEFERAIDRIETLARERAEQYFLDQSNDSELVFDAMTHHPAVVSVLETAPSSTDDCESGRRLGRAVAMARIKFVNDNWQSFAKFALTHRGFDPQWPANDAQILEGARK